MRGRISIALLVLTQLVATGDASARVDLVTEFSQNFVHSEQKASSGNGAGDVTLRDQGLAWRLRFSTLLVERHGRDLLFSAGPYFRKGVLFTLSNYGTAIEAPGSMEVGFDLGVSWFGVARTYFSMSPEWSFSYTSREVTGDPGHDTEVEFRHQSLGFRLEVPFPFLALESEEGDGRILFGLAGSYYSDVVRSFKFRPLNYSETNFPGLELNNEIENTQDRGVRWTLGLFMNVRI